MGACDLRFFFGKCAFHSMYGVPWCEISLCSWARMGCRNSIGVRVYRYVSG